MPPATARRCACLYNSHTLLLVTALLSLAALARCAWPASLSGTPPRVVKAPSVRAVAVAPSRVAPPVVKSDQYLISTIIYYGRISNIKISLLDLLATALVSSRALVVPELSECAVDGYDRSFGGLFDDATPLTRHVRSFGSFDAHAACNGSVAILDPGPWSDAPTSFGGVDVGKKHVEHLPAPPGVTPDFLTYAEQQAGPVHSSFFAPGQRRAYPQYRKDALFVEKIAALTERCVVLGKNFQSVNWERHPEPFVRALRSLVPAPPVRAAALDFLRDHGLAGGTSAGCPRGRPEAAEDLSPADVKALLSVPDGEGWGSSGTSASDDGGAHFLGVHLRMGDFLTDQAHVGFGVTCNKDPAILVARVRAALKAHAHLTRIVVSTDDFSSACYRGLVDAFGEEPRASAVARVEALHRAGPEKAAIHAAASRPGGLVIPTRGGSGYRGSTCSAALFDQEVIGHAGFFFGDAESSFSEAIHRTRTLRCGASAASTVWLTPEST